MLVLENWFIFILYTPQIKIILLTKPNFCIEKISSTNNYNRMNKKTHSSMKTRNYIKKQCYGLVLHNTATSIYHN